MAVAILVGQSFFVSHNEFDNCTEPHLVPPAGHIFHFITLLYYFSTLINDKCYLKNYWSELQRLVNYFTTRKVIANWSFLK